MTKEQKQKLIKLRCKAWGITEDEYYCNQCSDFSLEDMARVYRRGKNKGARDKAIQNVGFYQKQMQDIYDKKNKQIQIDAEHIRALQKQNGELTDKVKELEQKLEQTEKDLADYQFNYPTIKELQKENEELKKKVGEYQIGIFDEIEKRDKNLTKAKEIIREFVDWANWQGNSKCPSFRSIQDKAEQFLNEVEK